VPARGQVFEPLEINGLSAGVQFLLTADAQLSSFPRREKDAQDGRQVTIRAPGKRYLN